MRCLLLSLTFVPTIVCTGLPTMCYREHIVESNPTEEKCLATMVYGEARGEVESGMVAVAYTAVNRAAKKTVCKTVLAPKQYSIFNNNPALRAAALSLHIEPKQKNIIDNESWQKSVRVAEKVMRREVPDPAMGSTHYISDTVMKSKGYIYPKWSKEYIQVASIGAHRFFKEKAKVPVNKP